MLITSLISWFMLGCRQQTWRRLSLLTIVAALSGCAMVGSMLPGGPHPLADVRSLGMAFIGHPSVEVPARLAPGPAGELAVRSSAVGVSLLWVGGWLVAAPLWMPGILVSEEAACRAAVDTHPEQVAALRQELSAWNVLADLNRQLAVQLTGRAPQFVVLVDVVQREIAPSVPAQRAAVEPLPRLLAVASERGAQAVTIFEVSSVQLHAQGAASCSSSLFVRGRVRVLRASDGALLEMRPVQDQGCRRNADVPLERVLSSADMLTILKQAAVDCAARELIHWTDQLWSSRRSD